jgi:hypothetical protein
MRRSLPLLHDLLERFDFAGVHGLALQGRSHSGSSMG